MTPTARGICNSCNQGRQITTAGLIRQHNRGTSLCPGSGQPAAGFPIHERPQPAPSPKLPAPPAEETYGRSCDGGHCEAPSVGWRWYRDVKEWLPVCGRHMDGLPGRTRIYDQQGDQP